MRTSRQRRPDQALVVQADNLGTGLPQVIVAMISSNMSRAHHPSRVLVSLNSPEGKASGLLTDSVVMTDNLATIMEAAIYKSIGILPMTSVDQSLRLTLGLASS